MVQKKGREYIKGPIPLDESWWSEVLNDVEAWYREEQGNGNSETPQNDFQDDIPSGITMRASTKIRSSEEDSDENVIDWDYTRQLYQHDQVIDLEVSNYNRGGLLVHGKGVQGFVPTSHLIDLVNPISTTDSESLADYIGESLRLKVIECDQDRGRIVLSERAAQTDSGSRLALLNNLHVGDKVNGLVTTITDFGVFVDLGGVEGLIHISELSWGRVCHPDNIVSIGDEIEVYILDINRARIRVALSLKRLHPNPWDSVHLRYHPGDITSAIITNIVSFGAFARLEEGLDGLIHVSEIRKLGDGKKIDDIVAEGQQVEVCILHIDSDQQRLGLGLFFGNNGVV